MEKELEQFLDDLTQGIRQLRRASKKYQDRHPRKGPPQPPARNLRTVGEYVDRLLGMFHDFVHQLSPELIHSSQHEDQLAKRLERRRRVDEEVVKRSPWHEFTGKKSRRQQAAGEEEE